MIFNEIIEHGGKAIMSQKEHECGSDRIAEAVESMDVDIVVNVQGDAPLTPPHYVETLIKSLSGSPDVKMATPVLRTEAEHVEALRADRKAGRVGATTAVFDRNINGWVAIPDDYELPDNQQDRDMIARELLIKFQMSPDHPLVVLNKAYRKF